MRYSVLAFLTVEKEPEAMVGEVLRFSKNFILQGMSVYYQPGASQRKVKEALSTSSAGVKVR